MIQDKFYPATWKKYGEVWEGAVGQCRAITANTLKSVLAVIGIWWIFISFGISWFTLIASFVVLCFVGKWMAIVFWNWREYWVINYDTSIIMKPQWPKMGGTEEEWTKRKIFD